MDYSLYQNHGCDNNINGNDDDDNNNNNNNNNNNSNNNSYELLLLSSHGQVRCSLALAGYNLKMLSG